MKQNPFDRPTFDSRSNSISDLGLGTSSSLLTVAARVNSVADSLTRGTLTEKYGSKVLLTSLQVGQTTVDRNCPLHRSTTQLSLRFLNVSKKSRATFHRALVVVDS